MRYFVFASHGSFADGVLNAVELITGKHDNIWTICAYTNDKEESLEDQIANSFKRITANDELVVVTDIFGGSVNNEFLLRLNDKRIHVIAGLNLPLVIELITASEHERDTAKLIMNALQNAKESIQYCNAKLEQENLDDDF